MSEKELEKRCNELFFQVNEKTERIATLEKENAVLRKEWQEQVQKATDEGYARTLQTIQLTKAKEIIKDLMSFSVRLCDCRHTIDFEKTREQAVQFLKGE